MEGGEEAGRQPGGSTRPRPGLEGGGLCYPHLRAAQTSGYSSETALFDSRATAGLVCHWSHALLTMGSVSLPLTSPLLSPRVLVSTSMRLTLAWGFPGAASCRLGQHSASLLAPSSPQPAPTSVLTAPQAQGLPAQSLHPGILQFSYSFWPLEPLTQLLPEQRGRLGPRKGKELAQDHTACQSQAPARAQEMTAKVVGW